MKSNEEFISKLASIERLDHIKPLEAYNGATEKIWFYCSIHKIKFQKEPHSLYRSLGCKQCGIEAVKNAQRKPTKQYIDELRDVNPEIELFVEVEDYISAHTPILHRCKKCHNIWPVRPNNLLENKSKCPECIGRKVTKKNCLWAKRPDIARLLLDKNDGYKYKKGSNVKVCWKCEKCGFIVRDKAINDVTQSGFSCPRCRDGVSYPNKVIMFLLEQLNVDFIREKSFRWSNKKRYDFYIPSKNCIIEVHGGGHYFHGFESYHSQTLEEVQKNDLYKENIAKENNIELYIVINASLSEIEFIKKNVLCSKLPEILKFPNEIDWDLIHKNALDSNVVIACDLYNKRIYCRYEIAKILGVTERAIRDYLKKGAISDLCKYPEDAYRIRRNKGNMKTSGNPRIVCTTTKKAFLKQTEAMRYYGI